MNREKQIPKPGHKGDLVPPETPLIGAGMGVIAGAFLPGKDVDLVVISQELPDQLNLDIKL